MAKKRAEALPIHKTAALETKRSSQRGLAIGWGYLFIVVFVFALGILIGRETLSKKEKVLEFGTGIPLNPGPWGAMEYVPITIAAPSELLSVKKTQETPVRWMFKGYSREHLVTLFDTIKMPAAMRDDMLAPARLHLLDKDVEMFPTQSSIVAMPEKVRHDLYQVLAGMPVNDNFKELFLTSEIDDLVKNKDISPQTHALLKSMSCTIGKYYICYCMPYLVSGIASYPEKEAFMKAITRQKTLLLKLRISPDSDINALTSYWGKAIWANGVRSLFESLKKVPNGARLDVVEVLPPHPSAELYTFPVPENPMNGPVEKRDCHWTSFNFFRDPPEPRFGDEAYTSQKLKSDYFPIDSDPRYGDLVLFGTPDDKIIHSAVYLADDIVFTKNGDNSKHPWILSTIAELKNIYSISVPPDKELRVLYFRCKYY